MPPVEKILDLTLSSLPSRLSLHTSYHQINPDPVASFPSLHAGYPFLIFLFALYYFKKKAWWFFPYVLAVWFSIVYLGEHYVVDVIAGALYAFISFLVARKLVNSVNLHRWFEKIEGILTSKILNFKS